MTDGCVSLKNCLVCNSELTEIIDLGDQPLANGFLDRVKVDFLQNYIYDRCDTARPKAREACETNRSTTIHNQSAVRCWNVDNRYKS